MWLWPSVLSVLYHEGIIVDSQSDREHENIFYVWTFTMLNSMAKDQIILANKHKGGGDCIRLKIHWHTLPTWEHGQYTFAAFVLLTGLKIFGCAKKLAICFQIIWVFSDSFAQCISSDNIESAPNRCTQPSLGQPESNHKLLARTHFNQC